MKDEPPYEFQNLYVKRQRSKERGNRQYNAMEKTNMNLDKIFCLHIGHGSVNNCTK